jgi:hypothetical protein
MGSHRWPRGERRERAQRLAPFPDALGLPSGCGKLVSYVRISQEQYDSMMLFLMTFVVDQNNDGSALWITRTQSISMVDPNVSLKVEVPA